MKHFFYDNGSTLLKGFVGISSTMFASLSPIVGDIDTALQLLAKFLAVLVAALTAISIYKKMRREDRDDERRNSRRRNHGFAMFAIAAILFTQGGCAMLDRGYKKEIVEVPATIVRTNTVLVTNTVVVLETNIVAGTSEPEIVVKEVRTVVTPTLTFDYAPAHTVTNLVPIDGVKSTITAIGNAGSDAGIPGAGLIGGLLALAYSGYANFRNKRAVTTAQKVSASLVTGIEAVREFLQQTPEGRALDPQVKDFLIRHQEQFGTLDDVSKLVNELTGNTVK